MVEEQNHLLMFTLKINVLSPTPHFTSTKRTTASTTRNMATATQRSVALLCPAIVARDHVFRSSATEQGRQDKEKRKEEVPISGLRPDRDWGAFK
jgi:hypothetical protein